MSGALSRGEALNLLVEHTPYGTEDADRTSCAVSAIIAAFEWGSNMGRIEAGGVNPSAALQGSGSPSEAEERAAATESELWSLIRAYAAGRIDCDRSNGTLSQAYLSLSESNLKDALRAALHPSASRTEPREA